MSSDRKLILLALDGSDQSMEVVKYICRAVNLSQAQVVLFSVLDKVPDVFWDWEQDSTADRHTDQLKAWAEYKEKKMRQCMTEACKLLGASGVPPGAMTCTLQRRKEGIARDLICECKYGYSAIAFGRRGIGQMDDSMVGSIASKMFINVADAPVCMVGGKPRPGKILVGLDSSLSSVRVVNFVGRILRAGDPSVTLLHVTRVPRAGNGHALDEARIRSITLEQESTMKPVFESAVKTLAACGFNPDKISTRIVEGAGSRALAIAEEARKGKYGAIVVGRKGVSDVQDFSMGRVAYKLGQVAKNVALWLVP